MSSRHTLEVVGLGLRATCAVCSSLLCSCFVEDLLDFACPMTGRWFLKKNSPLRGFSLGLLLAPVSPGQLACQVWGWDHLFLASFGQEFEL